MQTEKSLRQALEDEAQKHVVIIGAYGYSVGEFVDAIEDFANACKVLAQHLYEFFESVINIFNDHSDLLNEYWEKREPKREKDSYKLDFTRPIVRHQVTDRKPRHLIKKIIH